MSTEQTVNIPLLRKAVEWAEAEAAKPWEECQWEQTRYVSAPQQISMRDINGIEISNTRKSDDCGTCYCIAGYVGAMLGFDFDQVCGGRPASWSASDMDLCVDEYAANALGLPDGQADRLFMATNTIEDVRRIAEEIAGERL